MRKPGHFGWIDRLALNAPATTGMLGGLAAISLLCPPILPLTLGLGGTLWWRRRQLVNYVPLRVGPPLPSSKPGCAILQEPVASVVVPRDEGILFLGDEAFTGNEVWMSSSDIRCHTLILGDRWQRHRVMLGMAANALSWGSGFLWMTGTGSMAAYRDVLALSASYGRAHDMLVLNFQPGRCKSGIPDVASMRLNPFKNGSASSLTVLLMSAEGCLSPSPERGMWQGRTTAWLLGVMNVLCWRRDHLGHPLDVAVVRDALGLPACVEMGLDERVPHKVRQPLLNHLKSLPGFSLDRVKQSQTTLEQHSFLQMPLTDVLTCLNDVYGDVFVTPDTDIDLRDVVTNRRILVVILPDLQNSGEQGRIAGQIVLALLKTALGDIMTDPELQEEMSGNVRVPIRSAPFMALLDGTETALPHGMGIMSAQSRALNLALVHASDSLETFGDGKEARATLANTRNRIVLQEVDGQVPPPQGPTAVPANAWPSGGRFGGHGAYLDAGDKQLVFTPFQPEVPTNVRLVSLSPSKPIPMSAALAARNASAARRDQQGAAE